MKLEQINIDKLEESFLIQQYVDYLASQNLGISLVECPILSINVSDFVKGQCIPDAIIDYGQSSKGWLELTTFSRCQEMRQQIGDLRKHPEKFSGERFIAGVQPFNWLPSEFYTAVQTKSLKDYSQFAKIAQLKETGILVVFFVNNDPFFDFNEYTSFLTTVRDNHFWAYADFSNGCFEQIVFGGMVLTEKGIQIKFETILNLAEIEKIKHRSIRRLNSLTEYDAINS